MIKTVIRSNENMVIVFDEEGEQMPAYQGRYDEVREKILKDAAPETRFFIFPHKGTELKVVLKEEW